jgi:hypothetical protein
LDRQPIGSQHPIFSNRIFTEVDGAKLRATGRALIRYGVIS